MIDKKISAKIQKITNLEEGAAYWYGSFIESSGLTDGIVMFGDVKHKMTDIISRGDGVSYNSVDKNEIEANYNFLLDKFKEKGLIEDFIAGNGTIYPKIIGYNFYNDIEFYIPYRAKGETSLTGRFPTSMINALELAKFEKHGYEIKDKEILGMILN